MRELRGQVGVFTRLPMLCEQSQTSFSALRLFFFFLNPLFQVLTHLNTGLKIASGKESFSSNYKGVLSMAFPAMALPHVLQRLEMQLPDPP
jgi:hypothetical protein